MNFMAKLKAQIAAAKKGTAGTVAGIEGLRRHREELLEEQELIKSLSPSQEEAKAALDLGLVEIEEEAFRSFRRYHLSSLTRTNTPKLPEMDPEEVTGLLVATHRESIRAVLAAEVEKAYEAGDGITAADRAARLAEITAQLEEVERAEELAIRQAEAAGLEILRRRDVSPDGLLMTDAALGA